MLHTATKSRFLGEFQDNTSEPLPWYISSKEYIACQLFLLFAEPPNVECRANVEVLFSRQHLDAIRTITTQ